MDNIINDSIVNILKCRTDIVSIIVRQRAKFEGWLKFELANSLELQGMTNVRVETSESKSKSRCDISFTKDNVDYRVELKTPNTNWKILGIESGNKQITKNVKSIIDDSKKLNSPFGIVSFVMFPLQLEKDNWKPYIKRIANQTKVEILETNYKLLTVNIDNLNKCRLLVCSFRSKSLPI
jgi:hypothetical protein